MNSLKNIFLVAFIGICSNTLAQQIETAPLYKDGDKIGIGVGNSSASSYSTLDVEGPHTSLKYASQLHLHSTAVENGLFLGSYGGTTSAVSIISSGNIYYSGGDHRALHPEASAMHMHQGRIRFFSDDGLTVGQNYRPTTRMIIMPNGNVGIGTGTLNEKLNVGGRIFLGEHYNGAGSWYESKDNSNWFAGLNSTDDFRIYYGGTDYFSLKKDGKLGIGTKTPISKLHVKGESNNYADVNFIVQDMYGNDDLVLRGNGALEIGYDIDAGPYMLAVGGSAIMEEVKVQVKEDWPDYVFNENFKLQNLSELESYIKKNKHLPGIPTAQEVQDNDGIELGEMNRLLLEKIEEMSLYIIEQNKMIKTQQKQIEDQDLKFEEFKKEILERIETINN